MDNSSVKAGHFSAATTWYNAGFSVIPIRADGTKRPLIEWRRFMEETLGQQAVDHYFGQLNAGIGVVCGKISGNLEMLELEGRAASSEHFTRIYEQCDLRNISWLFDTLTQHGYCEATPSGGFHFLYRISDHDVPGNTKVARRPATELELLENPQDKVKVLAETRGEGGYVIVAPTAGTVHPSGDAWSVVAGQIGTVPTITWEDRNMLHEAIHAALDEMPAPVAIPATPRLPVFQRQGTSPGDDFNERASWQEVLTPHGWVAVEQRGSETFWVRPGKDARRGGHSATTGLKGSGSEDRLYVFSSSTVFDPETPYNKFAAYALLEHGGRFSDAARELSRRGFGSRVQALAPASANAEAVAGAVGPNHWSHWAEELRQETVASLAAAMDVPRAIVAVPEKRNTIALGGGFPALCRDDLHAVPWDDSGMIDLFGSTMSGHLRYVSQEKGWRRWDGSVWIEDEHGSQVDGWKRIAQAAKKYHHTLAEEQHPSAGTYKTFTDSMNKMQRINGVPKLAQSHPDIAASVNDFDQRKDLVTLDNGVLDLTSGQLLPHDPKLMLTKKMNATFNPAVGTGRWGRFMEEVLPDPAVRGYLQRALGYAMLGDPNQRALFLLHGESGSGKSQVIEAMGMLFGDFGTGIPPSALLPKPKGGPNDDVHLLRGARLAFTSELNESAVLNEALIKSATGGDTQETRPLYGKYVKWRPEFVVFIATNFLPRISSTDNAIWRRVKPIKFEQVFVDEDGMPLTADGADKGVRIAREEPESILNWLLEGVAAFREHGLTPPERVREWTQTYRDEVDTVRQFVSEGQSEGRVKTGTNEETPFRDMYRGYVAWCQDAQLRPLPSNKFNQSMLSNGFVREKKERGIMWQGIGLVGHLLERLTPASAPAWGQSWTPGGR